MFKILEMIDSDKNVLEQLIDIDNEKMNDNITYDSFVKDSIKAMSSNNYFTSTKDLLFVTEGNPYVTLEILKCTDNLKCKVVIFINENYIALNKWIIERYHELGGADKHIIDFGSNYNKYIGKNYNVVPIGDNEYKKIVLRDFCG